jgi:mRNA interferase RelE/StbE
MCGLEDFESGQLNVRYQSNKKRRKELQLHEKSKNRVEAALNELRYSFTPNKLDIKKLKGFKNVYRVRLGKWRIIYRVDPKEKSILVHDILPKKTHTDKMPAETVWIRDLYLPDDVIPPYKGIEELYQPQSGACGLTRNITPVEMVA